MVAFAAGTQVRSGGWAGRAALEVCRGWGAEGARVVLADTALEEPELHRWAGLDNLEGVSDALMFGTSFQRLGQPLSDGLYLATAGTAVPDGEALRSHPRWRDFAAGFREAGAVLALYVPLDAPGSDALLTLADHVVVLATEAEADGLEVPGKAQRIATLGPTSADSEYVQPTLAGAEEADLPVEPAHAAAVALGLGDDAPDEGLEEGEPEETPPPEAPVDAGFEAEVETDGDVETDEDDPDSALAAFFEEVDVAPVEPDAVVVPGLQDDVSDEIEPDAGEPEDLAEDLEEHVEAAGAGAGDDEELTTADFGFGEDPFAGSGADTGTGVGGGEDSLAAVSAQDPLDVAPTRDPLGDAAGDDSPAGDGGDAPVAPTLDEILADGEEGDQVPDEVLSNPEPEGRPVVKRPRGRESRGRRGPSPVLLILLVVVLVAVLIAGYLGYIDIPGMRAMNSGVEEAGAAEVVDGQATAAPDGVAPLPRPGEADPAAGPDTSGEAAGTTGASFEALNPVVPWVLAVGSFDDLATARSREQDLAATGVRFIVAPVEVDGRPFYRLLAGPVAASGDLGGIREALAPGLGSRDVGYAREARLAFLVGTAPSRTLADRHAEVMEALGIPAHVLQVTAADGDTRFRVYAGAYANPAEARYLESLLADAGFDDSPLTERRGRWPE